MMRGHYSLDRCGGQVAEENEPLKALLCSAMQRNRELRGRMQSSSNSSIYSFINDAPDEQAGPINVTEQLQSICDESQFQKDLVEARQRTSSPVNFRSFVRNSVLVDTTEFQDCPSDPLPHLRGAARERLLGEIAYQLDKRILCHIFQGHRRLYGFTLLNIPDKIIEVSTHPLTGKVDEGYRLHLTQRYRDLMEALKQFGYKAALHPTLSEFIVNTYGILSQRPGHSCFRSEDYNDPGLLRRWIAATVPPYLEKEVQIFLNCLCHMAEKDEKPLIIW